MREKEFGIWRPFTWQDYHDNVKNLCLGMVSLGLKKGDKVAMIGDNRPEGLWAEMAALCAGGIGVWLFQDCMMEEVKYIIDHSDAKFSSWARRRRRWTRPSPSRISARSLRRSSGTTRRG